MRELDFIDGFVSNTEPSIGEVSASGVGCFANDAAFIASKESAIAECGDLYHRTSDNTLRYYDGTSWHTVVDFESAQTISGQKTFGAKIKAKEGAGGGIDATSAGSLEIGASTATEVDIASTGVLTRILGDLRVEGTTTQVQTATLEVEDKNIEVNKGGDNTSAEGAGLEVDRTGTSGSLIYANAATSRFKIGDLGSEVEIADISSSQTITNKTIDADLNSITNIDDANVKVGANILRNKLQSGTANYVIINDGSGVLSEEQKLAVSRGGTNIDTYSIGDLIYAAASQILGRLGIGGEGQILKVISGLPAWDDEAAATEGAGFNVDAVLVNVAGEVLTNESGNVLVNNTATAPGSTNGQIIKSVKNDTGSAIGALKVVAWLDDGTVALADANTASISDIAGITQASIADGAFGNIIKGGLIPGALTGLGALPGQEVYLGETPGTFTLTAPSGGGDTIYLLGYAEPADGVASPTAEDLFFEPDFISGP